MHSTDEWIGVHEQTIAERAGRFDDGYSDWAAQWEGVHEQWTLEHKYGGVPEATITITSGAGGSPVPTSRDRNAVVKIA
jgi:hypothetical protein